MAFEFLTDDHLERYGHFNADPTPTQLGRYFTLEPPDLEFLQITARDQHLRLGLAVQLCTLRFLGTFLTDPTDVPKNAVQTLARQLGITDLRFAKPYLRRRSTRFEHAKAIREYLEYKDFDRLEILHLMRLLYSRLLVSDERPIVLFDLATHELASRNVVLPGATTLARIIVRVRERVSTRLFDNLAKRLSKAQIERLESLLLAPKGERATRLETLRTPPSRISSSALTAALERVETIRALGVGKLDLSDVPDSRLTGLAQHALIAWGGQIAKLGRARRRATLLAVAQQLERSATDDALEVFDGLMNTLELKGSRARRRERLRTLKDLDGAALTLRDAVRLVIDEGIPTAKLRAAIYQQIGETALFQAIVKVSDLASEATDEDAEAWMNAANVVARFIVPLLSVIRFEGTPAAAGLLEAIKFLTRSSGKARADWGAIPRAFVPRRWLSLVFPGGELHRPAYIVCVAHLLQQALKRREVFVKRSLRHGDPRAQLLQGEAWTSVKNDLCRSLNLPAKPQPELERLATTLDQTYRAVLKQLENDTEIVLKDVGGVLTPIVAPLEALQESDGVKALDARVEARLPDIDLSELLLEVNACTGFFDELGLVSGGATRSDDINVSVCAVLVAQACNIGLKAVAQEHIPALKIGRLAQVQQNYLRLDTLTRANARLVDFHTTLPLARAWGGGEVASADGLRFVVPVRSVVTGSNSKYFGAGRGVTYYTLTSDKFTMLHGIVIPGTIRDSLYILSTLLEQRTSLRPTEIMSDTAGYSDVIFGLFQLLGYQFSPRLADLEGMRYWRVDKAADYGSLNDLSKHRINTDLIAQHWEDILRVVGSLKLGVVAAPDVMRVLARDGSLSGLGKAIAEVGRIAKTLYLLRYISDETYRRRIHTQLNRGESRGRIARKIYHGNKGELRQKYREGMENQLGALGLVVNAVALWNTRYLQAALDLIGAMGDEVKPEDVARLSPLKWQHINVLGRYHFELSPDAAGGDLRPLRDPEAMDILELLWED